MHCAARTDGTFLFPCHSLPCISSLHRLAALFFCTTMFCTNFLNVQGLLMTSPGGINFTKCAGKIGKAVQSESNLKLVMANKNMWRDLSSRASKVKDWQINVQADKPGARSRQGREQARGATVLSIIMSSSIISIIVIITTIVMMVT